MSPLLPRWRLDVTWGDRWMLRVYDLLFYALALLVLLWFVQ